MERVIDFNDLSLADPGGDFLSPAGTSANTLFSSPLSTRSGSTGGVGIVLRVFKSGGVGTKVWSVEEWWLIREVVGFVQGSDVKPKIIRDRRSI
jgi:hypothetical protein